MRIDLRKIKTVFICPDHNEKYNTRRKHMETILTKHGFENVIMYKSGTDYPQCLQNSIYNILQQNLDTPVFVLEDDIVFCKDPEFVFDIPDDTDAFYAGISGTCMDFEITGRNRNVQRRDYEIVDSKLIKIKNMLSAHAILYLSRDFKERLSKEIIASTMPVDVTLCKYQPLYNVYGLQLPICWQSTRFNSSSWPEHVTKARCVETGCWIYEDAVEDEFDTDVALGT